MSVDFDRKKLWFRARIVFMQHSLSSALQLRHNIIVVRLVLGVHLKFEHNFNASHHPNAIGRGICGSRHRFGKELAIGAGFSVSMGTYPCSYRFPEKAHVAVPNIFQVLLQRCATHGTGGRLGFAGVYISV